MNVRLRQILVCCIVMLSVGCTAVNMQSSRDPAFDGSLSRLYIYVDDAALNLGIGSAMKEALQQFMEPTGLQFTIRISNPVELKDDAFVAEAVSRGCDGLLTIQPTSAMVNGYGAITRITFDVSLFDLRTAKRIWRAQLVDTNGSSASATRLRKTVETIIGGLRDDHLIGVPEQDPGPQS